MVTGRRKYGKGLEVPCVYHFLSSEKIITNIANLLLGLKPISEDFVKAWLSTHEDKLKEGKVGFQEVKGGGSSFRYET